MNAPVCLITPPSTFLMDERVFVSLGILRVAACLERDGVPVEHVDLSGIANFEDAMRDHASRSEAHVFGLTATTPQMPATTRVVAVLREARPDARIILGGPHVTLVNAARKLEAKAGKDGRAHRAFDRLDEMFDVLVAGDGDDAIFSAITENAPRLIDADDPKGPLFLTDARYEELPFPARHLVDMGSYHYTIDGVRSGSAVFQLGCPYMCAFSLTGDTLISTSAGFKRMADLVVDDGVIERCVHGGSVRVHRIDASVATHAGWRDGVEVVDEGERPVFRIQAENGIAVGATEDHPFLVVNDEHDDVVWKTVGEMKIGDWLVIKDPQREWPTEYVSLAELTTFPPIPPGGFQRRGDHRIPKCLTPDVAWLIGMMIGDGCIPLDGRPSVHVCVTNSVRDRLVRVFRENFNVNLSIRPSSLTDKMQHGWIHSRLVYSFFTETLGIRPGDKLHIPDAVLCSPRDVLAAFMEGLFDADGHVPKDGGAAYLTTISHDLAREVANAMLMLGLVPSIVSGEGKGYKAGRCYRVGQFLNDRIPTTRALYRSLKSGRWFWRTPRQPSTFLGVRRRTLRAARMEHQLDREGMHYVRVEAITPGLPERVYDLRVPHDHSFLADGLVSHNCGGRSSPMLRQIRTRTTESIVAEIRGLYTDYGFRALMAYDDELNVNKECVPLMNAIADLGVDLGVDFRLRGFIKSNLFTDEQAAAMYRAGFRWILVGFESGSPRILDNIQKKATREQNNECMAIARRHGLKVKALMSIGHAGESEETIRQTKEWLLDQRPDDFDCTVISCYPGTPYYDRAEQILPDSPDVWTYVAKNGDRLHAYDVDYSVISDAYKGIPGEYRSYVFTDHLTADDLVRLRDALEDDVRRILGIPFNAGAPGVRYEASMGQLPGTILRSSRGAVCA